MLKQNDYVVIELSGENKGKEAIMKVDTIPNNDLADCTGYQKDLSFFNSVLDPKNEYKFASQEQIIEFDTEFKEMVLEYENNEIDSLISDMKDMSQEQIGYMQIQVDKQWMPGFVEYLQDDKKNEFYDKITEKYGKENTFTNQFLDRSFFSEQEQSKVIEIRSNKLNSKEKESVESILENNDTDTLFKALEKHSEIRFDTLYSKYLQENNLTLKEREELITLDNPINTSERIKNRLDTIGKIENKNDNIKKKESDLLEVLDNGNEKNNFLNNECKDIKESGKNNNNVSEKRQQRMNMMKKMQELDR